MYISKEQSEELDRAIKSLEVAFRSFIADTLYNEYSNSSLFKNALESISISSDLIYARKFTAKLVEYKRDSNKLYNTINECQNALNTKVFNNEVLFVSDLINLLLLFFNKHFSSHLIIKEFNSIIDFHYCCSLYHKIRNNLSHPASHPIIDSDANKVIYFINNICSSLDEKYFWYDSKDKIIKNVDNYKKINYQLILKYSNLNLASAFHRSLLCRDEVINNLYSVLLGENGRKRLAGSVVLFGYGGVGKTAITTEFLHKVTKDKLDGKYKDIEYLLFFSSKNEYLKENKTTGEFYIENTKSQFTTLDELIILICLSLNINNIEEIETLSGKGIIAIDNIENLDKLEKEAIINFIPTITRNVQFIVTSRNEESCEEKIHIEEFKNNQLGVKFILELIESEDLDITLNDEQIKELLSVSKGNALIIVQALNIIDRNVSTFNEVVKSLGSMKSKNTAMIADFMYKNTFDKSLKYLLEKEYPINLVLQIIFLYDEEIELYSISKLCNITVLDAEYICKYLAERLIIKKIGEYYRLNEFAEKFIFIKLLPDRFELSKIKDKVRTHKERMKKKLSEFNKKLESNYQLQQNVEEWQPKNYMDRMIIAELFPIYARAQQFINKKDKVNYEQCIKEFDEHSFITNHPYVPLQKARILLLGYNKFYRNDKNILEEIESLFEQAVSDIEYDYTYLYGCLSHASLLMFFGAFLSRQLKQYSRSIRFLEEAKDFFDGSKGKGWFSTCNFLSHSYLLMYNETKDNAYEDQLKKVVREVISNTPPSFNIDKYKNKFQEYVV